MLTENDRATIYQLVAAGDADGVIAFIEKPRRPARRWALVEGKEEGQGWVVRTPDGSLTPGFETRDAARAAARALNGRRLRVIGSWTERGKPWLVVDEHNKLVGTYSTRAAARKAARELV